MTLLYSSDFETGDFTGWDSNVTSSGGTNTVAAGAAYAGSYGYRSTQPGASNANAYIEEAVSAPASQVVYLRFRWKWSATNTGGGIRVFGIGFETWPNRIISLQRFSGGNYSMNVRNRDGTYTNVALSTQPTTQDNWYLVEFTYDWSGANPVATCRLDGTQVAQHTDTTSGSVPTPTHIRIGTYEEAWTWVGSNDFDEVEVHDTDAGSAGTDHTDEQVDDAGASDLSTSVQSASRVQQDSAGTDLPVHSVTHARSSVDDAGATDTSARAVTASRAQQDQAGDDFFTQVGAVGRSQIDSAGQDVSASVSLSARSGVETAGSDIAAQETVSSRSRADDAGATDAGASVVGEIVTEVDDAGATDTSSRTIVASRASADSAGEDVVVSQSVVARSQTDGGATDVSSYELTEAGSHTATDDAGATDASNQATTFHRSEADAAGEDAVVQVGVSTREGADDAGATDDVVVAQGWVRSSVDDAGASDLSTAQVISADAVTATDDAGALDLGSYVLAAVRSSADDAGAADAPGQSAAFSRSGVDPAGTDVSTSRLGFIPVRSTPLGVQMTGASRGVAVANLKRAVVTNPKRNVRVR